MKTELTKRLMQLSKDLVSTAQGMTLNAINRNSVEKCIEAWTNAGSEYAQSSSATTKKSFLFKINMCKAQLDTATYRLELLMGTAKDKKADLEKLYIEAKDLAIIFSKISRKLKKSGEKKVEDEESDEK